MLPDPLKGSVGNDPALSSSGGRFEIRVIGIGVLPITAHNRSLCRGRASIMSRPDCCGGSTTAVQDASETGDSVTQTKEKIRIMPYPVTPGTSGISGSGSGSATLSTFSHFRLRPELERAVAAAGYETPRPIQTGTIPAVLAGRDVLGLAQTGTGKTVAFGLPVLERLLAKPGRGPRVLVVAPTRELVLQIEAEFRSLARFTRIRTVTIFGGVSGRAQIQKLQRRPEIIVACPGRLLDLLGQGHVRLGGIETLVLDEADHMFDMGFLPDIRRIIAALPKKRQNLLFAATMPREIRGLAEQILCNPAVAELEHSMPASTIDHTLYWVPQNRKLALLCNILKDRACTSGIVFTRTKHRAKRLARDLEKINYRAVALQGNMTQSARDRAMERFRRGRCDILVATDIASRGIDVEHVSHVINFDIPGTPDAYTHRIGRTGRSERSGTAYTFATGDDASIVRAIERMIGAKILRSEVDGFTVPEPQYESRRGKDAKKRRPSNGRSGGNHPSNGRSGGNRPSPWSDSRGRRRGRKAARPAGRPNR
jgi:ATP-dependent RNA helicase RhlE